MAVYNDGVGWHYSGYMLTREEKQRVALLQGTLDVRILRILQFGAQHGQGMARAIDSQSARVLLVDHGAGYPALQRREARGWVFADWGISKNNRKARFYQPSKLGRTQLTVYTSRWRKPANAIGNIPGPEATEA